MNRIYADWIGGWLTRNNYICRGFCTSATKEMAEAFPELKRVLGFVDFPNGGHLEHAWCETEDGEVIDPTAQQFRDYPSFCYRAWKPGDEVKVGRCMECGDDIYDKPEALGGGRRCFCGKECETRFTVDHPWLSNDSPPP